MGLPVNRYSGLRVLFVVMPMEATVRLLSPVLLAGLLIPIAVMAQPAEDQKPAIGQVLGQGEQAQHPETQPQGVRPPSPDTNAQTAGDLQSALSAFYKAPPDLSGKPVPRPSEVASNPDQPTDPSVSANPSDMTSREVR